MNQSGREGRQQQFRQQQQGQLPQHQFSHGGGVQMDLFQEDNLVPIKLSIPSSSLLAEEDNSGESLPMARLIIAVGLAEQLPPLHDLEAIEDKIRQEEAAREQEQRLKQQRVVRLAQSALAFETPEAYLLRIKSDTGNASVLSRSDQQEEECEFDYFYNLNRVQFNRLQFRMQ